MSAGIFSLPSSEALADAEASPPAAASPDSQAVVVSASTEARATAAGTGEILRRVLPPRPAVDDVRMDRMI
ncbi:hypothetical protein GCM10023086_46250 [Streptomyces venetus]|uniref:FXSXX-COOH protein n=1 Tax=Streptomyces venetus TaxID=1701086 RepID=A0ABP8GC12_9ACTN